MKVDRPTFQDLSFDAGDEIPAEYDLVQLKYDGRWCRLEVEDGLAVGYSRTGRQMFRVVVHPQLTGMTLLGEYIYGTQWAATSGMHCALRMFDLVEVAGADVRQAPLHKRLSWLAKVVDLIKPYFIDIDIAATHIAGAIPDLWADMVESKGWEGLVLKDSMAAYGAPWLRMKRVETMDLKCCGFNFSDDGNGSELRTLSGLTEDGQVVKVGGLTRQQRDDIMDNHDYYQGRTFEASCNGVTDSGSLRHPTFLGWRDDK